MVQLYGFTGTALYVPLTLHTHGYTGRVCRKLGCSKVSVTALPRYGFTVCIAATQSDQLERARAIAGYKHVSSTDANGRRLVVARVLPWP